MNITKFFLLLSLIFALNSSNITAQNPKISQKLSQTLNSSKESEYSVWIFFKDKGGNTKAKLTEAENKLPKHAVERRKKLMKNKTSVATFYDIPVLNTYVSEISKHILKLRHKSNWLNAISAEVTKNQINKISNFPFVKKIDIVRKGKISRKNNDVDFANAYRKFSFPNSAKYNLNYGSSLNQNEQINVPAAHDLGYNGNGIIICVMDAGFNNLEHPVFNYMQSSGHILGTWDFVNNDTIVDDQGDMGSGSHGTMTLSTIGGFEQGQLIGPAYDAKFILTKTENTDSETTVEEDNWVAAMEWAENNWGPDITSTSLGYIDFDDGTGYDPSELDGNTATITIGADIAASLGILVVNSAGNEGSGTTTIGAPADGDSVLAVGAVDADGYRVYFSSVGPTGDGRIKPEVMAQGSGVTVAQSGSGTGYTTADGTSFSCPLTAGAAAVLMQMVPSASNMDIFEALKMTANNHENPNNEYGWGIINIMAAYQYFAPEIIHNPLFDTEDYNGPYTVNAQINSRTDLTSGGQKLYWRRDGGAWQNITMTESNSTWSADIPGNGSSAVYDYYIEAQNDISTRTLPENAPTSYFTFNAAPDNTPPTVTHNPIKEYYINLWNDAKIIAEITDNTGVDLQNSYIEWKINGNPKNNFGFAYEGNNVYAANFPGAELNIGDIVSYKIVAKDNANNQHTTYFPESGYNDFGITDRISFEQNQFSHNWIFEGNQNWSVSSDQSQDGTYSAKSGNIDDSQTSSISLTFTCEEDGDISFYKKVSSEENWDYFRFYINGTQQAEWSGEVNWSNETYPITAGTYTLKWEYDKDGSISQGSDYAWLDNITLPASATVSVKNIEKNTISIYPNPASRIVNINLSDDTDKINIAVFNITGQKIYSESYNKQKQISINTSDFKTGIYFFSINTKEKSYLKKIIISR